VRAPTAVVALVTQAVEDEGDHGMGEDAYCWELGEPRDASFPSSAQAQVDLERGRSGRRDRR
jgi:hypothetical protein